MEVRPRRPLGDSEEQPNLPMAEPLDVMEEDDGSLSRCEPSQGCSEASSQVSGLPRIAELRRKALRQLVRVPHLAPTRNVQRRIGYYTVQPCPKRLIRSETIQRTIGVQKPLLHSIFGILVGGDDRPGNRVRAPLVRADQRSERRRISALCRSNERPFIPWGLNHGLWYENAL